MDELGQPFEVVARRLGEHPVPEVEDVPRPPAGQRQDVARLPGDDVEGGQQDPGVEVALDAGAADPRPGLVEREAASRR